MRLAMKIKTDAKKKRRRIFLLLFKVVNKGVPGE